MVSIGLIQILGTLVLIFLLGMIIKNSLKRGYDLLNSFLMVLLVILILIVLFPGYLNRILGAIGFIRPLDAFLAFVSVSSLLLVIKIYLKQMEMDSNISEIIRHMALEKWNKSKKE